MIGKKTMFLWPILICLLSLFVFCSCATDSPPRVDTPAREDILRVGVSANSPPLIYKQGEDIIGLEAELAKELGKFLGKSVVFVELKWTDQIPALLENRTDIIMSGMSMTNAREYKLTFCEPYFRTGQIALIRQISKPYVPKAGYYGLRAWAPSITIGVVQGTTGEFFAKKYFSTAKKIKSFSTSEKAVAALQNGWYDGYEIDAFIYDAPMVYYLTAGHEGTLSPMPALLTEEYLAWGVRKNDAELLKAANAFLKKMNEEKKLGPIIQRWIPFM